MYSKEIITQNLEKVRPLFGYKGKKYTFELQDYSYEYITQAIDEINNYINIDLYENTKDTSKTRIYLKHIDKPFTLDNLPIDAVKFITNEKIKCQLSCWHFMDNYYKISDHRNRFVQYSPTKPQLVWRHINAKLQNLKRPIRELRGKARQTTSSTEAQGKMLHRLCYQPDVKSVIASYEDNSSKILSKMLTDALFRLPFWNRPLLKRFESGSFYEFNNNAYLDISYGTRHTLSTGTTPTVALCSEISKYLYPKESIEASLIRAMHETIDLLQIFESTADGNDDNNYFKQKWYETVKGMEDGTSSLYASFIPWVLRDDIYPTPDWIRGRFAFNNYKPSIEMLAYARKIENYIRTNPDLSAVCGNNYTIPIEQIFFYEISYKEAESRGELYLFLQEMPGTPEEMFQNAGMSVYPIQVISYYDSKVYEIIPEVYKIKGDQTEIDPEFWPKSDEILENGKVIEVKPRWSEDDRSSYELVQIKFNGWDRFDYKNKILIWEHPTKQFKYGLANDNSDGLGEKLSDDAVLEIFRKGTIRHKDKQVCEFATPDMSPGRIWAVAHCLGTYYSPIEQLLLAIELNKGGVEVVNNLLNRGWGNFFQAHDERQIGKDLSEVRKLGFETNNRNRPLIQNHLSNFLIGKWADIYSNELLKELKNLKKKTRMDGIVKYHGANDNRFMTIAIILYCLHESEILGYQQASWEKRKKEEESLFVAPKWRGYEVQHEEFNLNNMTRVLEDYTNEDDLGNFDIEVL
jgi:hypothetical protein